MTNGKPRLFFWGQVAEGTTAKARRDALVTLGCQVETGSSWDLIRGSSRFAYHAARRLGIGPLVRAENRALLSAAKGAYDVIWIEKGIFLRAESLRALKAHCRVLVHFTPDPAFHFHTRTRHFLNSLPYYDICGTTKPSDLNMYALYGAHRVLLLSKSYNPAIHRIYPRQELETFQSDITFAGTWTQLKETLLRKIVERLPDAEIRVWGGEWQRKCLDQGILSRHRGPAGGILGEDYGRCLAGAKIGLGLLSTDIYAEEVITDRIMEIPACGALLVAPRTPEIEAVFRDGEEALLFGSDQELLNKLQWALTHEEERKVIAAQGHARVSAGTYRDQDVVERLLNEAMNLTRQEAN